MPPSVNSFFFFLFGLPSIRQTYLTGTSPWLEAFLNVFFRPSCLGETCSADSRGGVTNKMKQRLSLAKDVGNCEPTIKLKAGQNVSHSSRRSRAQAELPAPPTLGQLPPL